MFDIVIPVLLSFFLGPGMGQLYNKEFKKAGYLIALSLVVLAGSIKWFYTAAMPYLPTDVSTVDRASLQAMIDNASAHIMHSHPGTIYTYFFISSALWIYSVVDAFYGASRRRTRKQT